MKRPLLLLLFGGMLWQAVPPGAFTRNNPTPVDERTFEASRVGFLGATLPGRIERGDFERIILRRAGDHHLPVTIHFREWRMADAPNLWTMPLPHVLKVEIDQEGANVLLGEGAGAFGRMTLAVGRIFNLPMIVRNSANEARDVDIRATLGGTGTAVRVTLEPGDNYVIANLRPTKVGSFHPTIAFNDGTLSEVGGAMVRLQADVVETGTLRLRTSDGGAPVHARVYLTGADGLAYGPAEGTLSKITWTAGDYFFYSTGEQEIELPVGEARVEIVRGFEYEPFESTVEIKAGETTSLDARLERFSHVAEDGWWSGDVHIHANYNDHEFITPEDMLVQALGEDLNVANLMVANSTGTQIHDRQYFSGKPHELSHPRHVLRWIEEMRSRIYGHMCLPGVERLVEPLYTGFQGSPHPYDYPPNYNQAVGAQEAGGVASYAHPGYRFTDDPSTMSATELPVDLALGAVEAMDVLANPNEEASVPYWYALLNTGLKCAISGGSDSFTNRRHHWLPGGQRVYVQSGAELDYDAWIDAYREGRSFASNGPMLEFSVDGEAAGAELERSAGDRVQVRASARSWIPMAKLEIVRNGEVVAASEGPARELALDASVELTEGAWIAARVDGEFHRYLVNDSGLFAHTGPVYLRVDGDLAARREDAEFFVRWIDRLIEQVAARGRFERPEHLEEVRTLFERGRAYYQEVAARGH